MKKPNRLINEKNPYLLQHAYNPVDWYPWCNEAFEKAKAENKPVFLSIGYSTCHWCHVMEKESFEDTEVADLMNETFISIKVDREERPDIDGIYMSACQMITGSGGWPLTVVMTPDKKPFFIGTYFPKYNRFNRIGLMELIPKLKEIWISRKDEVQRSAEEITVAINNQSTAEVSEEINESVLDKAYNELSRNFDEESGGFGTAPKFPSPHNLMFLLRYWKRKNEPIALEIVEKTLTQMRLGGIYDHIGFGFARYSTDRNWLIPHFEKMLYDQAMLVLAFTETYLATKNHFYKKTAEEILEYVLRDMTHNEGGLFSAEDADSEGVEGKFYLWSADEIRNILSKDESDLVIKAFNIKENGNWIDESKGTMTGTNIFHLKKSLDKLADESNLDQDDFLQRLEIIRKKLFDYREKRIHPHKDDKILTDWNSLMISALAKAYQAFNNRAYLDAAEKSFNFLKKNLINKDGKLLHRYKDGEAAVEAFIDDYAFLINALLDLYESTFNLRYFEKALELQSIIDKEFWDNKGGYYFTSAQNEKLIARQKVIYDGAVPSGNSIVLLNLIRLFKITTDINYQNKIDMMIKYFSAQIYSMPSAFCMFLCGLNFLFSDSTEIIIVSKNKDDISNEALDLIRNDFNPDKIIILKLAEQDEKFNVIFPYTKWMKLLDNKTTFYVCSNYSCKQPV
ncbi:MAG: thioredoxin domain-containing protein, partial [Ignavibacteriaceae bacterium]|nr:thioredoxin domain-containing protein [Ignavibacteriaceae bacterium]